MQAEKIKGKVPRPKHRSGVMPTMREEPDVKKIPRKQKHKKRIQPND